MFVGTPDLDSLLRTILSNPMMGGFVAFFLDNTISGNSAQFSTLKTNGSAYANRALVSHQRNIHMNERHILLAMYNMDL